MWIFAIAGLGVAEAVTVLLDAVTLTITPLLDGLISATLVVIVPPAIWIGLALSAKRLHDRGWSTSWLWLFGPTPVMTLMLYPQLGRVIFASLWVTDSYVLVIVPIGLVLIDIWAFIELFCLPGTAGNNRFGAAPSFDLPAGPDIRNA